MTPAPFAAELDKLSAALGRPFDVPEQQRYRPDDAPRLKHKPVRVARRNERKRLAVMRGVAEAGQNVPYGAMRAETQGTWLRAVQDSPELGRLRRDTYASTWAVAQLLAWTADWKSMTTRPTLAVLVERSGRSQATVGRALRRLRDAGLLGVVAKGRSAQFARVPGAGAEAAVYVLAVPLGPVDEHEHATAPGDVVDPPHARASHREGSSEPLRGAPVAAPAAPSGPSRARDGSVPRPTDATSGSPGPVRRLTTPGGDQLRPDDRLAPARALQARLAVLARISDRHVASAIREFVLAGWTTSELVAAIDARPDGSRWPHDGADGVGNVGAWLRYRLAAWRGPGGTVRPSPAQLAAAERHRAAAARRVAREQLEQQSAGRPPVQDSPGFRAYTAARAALPRRTR